MERQYERIAIVNRGEAAMRLIRAVRELNRQKHSKLSTVALFTGNRTPGKICTRG